jgi:hypothetical protein
MDYYIEYTSVNKIDVSTSFKAPIHHIMAQCFHVFCNTGGHSEEQQKRKTNLTMFPLLISGIPA